MRNMANREMLRYLTEPLREVALHHLHPAEDIVTAIYVNHHTHLVRERAYWFAWERQDQLPARAFILTPARAGNRPRGRVERFANLMLPLRTSQNLCGPKRINVCRSGAWNRHSTSAQNPMPA